MFPVDPDRARLAEDKDGRKPASCARETTGCTPLRSTKPSSTQSAGTRTKPGWGIDTYQNCSVHAAHTALCGASLRVSHREGLCVAVHA